MAALPVGSLADARLGHARDPPGRAQRRTRRAGDVPVPCFATASSRTGLGLTLCREILAVHGGRLTLAHRQDGGAVVTVYLP